MQWGSSVDMLVDMQESTGFVPPALLNRPLPRSDCTEYRQAFQRIGRGRQFNEGGAQPLTVNEIASYCWIRGITGDDKEVYLQLMGAMDDVFLDHVRKKQEQATKKAQSGH